MPGLFADLAMFRHLVPNRLTTKTTGDVIPAKAGIQDGKWSISEFQEGGHGASAGQVTKKR